ncbi:DJ-1/PfpI family protein [Cupriavidus basilensis]|uniref:DJ-1/PfpI family protein n=1 Tax=Cupriavidus basilensis TaxID=68895 RepID=A0ABT6AG43_9BURK|nr:DJ-1/PfpI family protein [Cupriavidus basilensis]MDF3831570.1 DJ-1/PfpI family protein [Cupriavidus basilensis]
MTAQNRMVASGTSMASPAASPEEIPTATANAKKRIGIVMFPSFETLDVVGPVEMWGNLPDYQILMVSEHGGSVRSAQGVETVATYSFDTAPQFDISIVPGGVGTRTEVGNPAMLELMRKQDKEPHGLLPFVQAQQFSRRPAF